MKRTLIGCAALALALLAACGPSKKAEAPALRVSAAASLGEVVAELNAAFERRFGMPVQVNFASSGALAQQILAAPRVDVFLSASEDWMDALADARRVEPGSARVLWSNELVVVAVAGSGVSVKTPGDLATADYHRLAIGDPAHVPAGRYAKDWLSGEQALGGGSLWDALQTRLLPSPDVRAALAQTTARRDVLAVVYATDYLSRASELERLYAVSASEGPRIAYAGAVVGESPRPELARAYLDFLRSDEAAAIIRRHGFILPRVAAES